MELLTVTALIQETKLVSGVLKVSWSIQTTKLNVLLAQLSTTLSVFSANKMRQRQPQEKLQFHLPVWVARLDSIMIEMKVSVCPARNTAHTVMLNTNATLVTKDTVQIFQLVNVASWPSPTVDSAPQTENAQFVHQNTI